MRIKRLYAFTLTEMIMVMLLTAVVVGVAYEVFQVVSKSYASFAAKNERINDLERLENWLRRDFRRSEVIYVNGRDVRMLLTTDTITYRIEDSLITRQGLRRDSFKINTLGFETRFLGKAPEIMPSPVDEITFTILLERQEIPEYFFKLYSAEQLIKLTDGINRHK